MSQWKALYYTSDDGGTKADLEEKQHVALLPDNPLHLDDVYFAGIELTSNRVALNMVLLAVCCVGGEVVLALETCDTHTGNVFYKKPKFGMNALIDS